MSVSFYAIRIKGTELYSSSQMNFAPFEDAIAQGVYFNQLKTAEKRLKEYTTYYKGGTKNYPVGHRWAVEKPNPNNLIGESWDFFTASKECYEQASKLYKITFVEDFELEIVELKMTVA